MDHTPDTRTTLVGANGPGLGEVKVRVAPDAVPGEVGVSQESPLAVERRAVAMETLGEGQHDVGVLVHLVPYLAVRNLPEGERDHAFPHPEGFADGFVRGPLAHLRGVVLYAVGKNSVKKKSGLAKKRNERETIRCHVEVRAPESDLRLVPFQTLDGVSLPPQVRLQLRAKLVMDTAPWPAHRPGNDKTRPSTTQ